MSYTRLSYGRLPWNDDEGEFSVLYLVFAIVSLIGIIIGIIACSYSPSILFGGDGGRIGHLFLALLFPPVELIVGSVEIHKQRTASAYQTKLI